MKRIYIVLFCAIFLGGCLMFNGQLIRFYDGDNPKDELQYYAIKDGALFLEGKKIGDVTQESGIQRVITDENGRQIAKFDGKNRVIKSYIYANAANYDPNATGENKEMAVASEYLSQWSRMIVREIHSTNGICNDYVSNLPIIQKTTTNFYDNSGLIHMIMRDRMTILKDFDREFTGDFAQIGFDKISGDELANVQKESKQNLKNMLNEICFPKK